VISSKRWTPEGHETYRLKEGAGIYVDKVFVTYAAVGTASSVHAPQQKKLIQKAVKTAADIGCLTSG